MTLKKKNRPIISRASEHTPVHKLLKELADVKYALDVSTIVAITDAQGIIIYANDAFCRASDFSREELLGKSHRLVNSDYHPKSFFKELWDTILDGKVWHGEIRNRSKKGRIYWVDTYIVPLLDEKKRPYQFVSVRREITRRKEMESEIESLSQKIIKVQEAERARISREIHDDLGQALATLKMMIQTNLKPVEGCPATREQSFESVISYLDGIIAKSRSLASNLRPSSFGLLGLKSSVVSLIDEFRANTPIEIHTHLCRMDGFVFADDPINLYRIVQEALTNILVHSGAKNVYVRFQKNQTHLHVKIEDDGQGFKPGEISSGKAESSGIGLSTIRERVNILKGELQIRSEPGKGTTLLFQIPIEREE